MVQDTEERIKKKHLMKPILAIVGLAALLIGAYYVVATFIDDESITSIDEISYQESIDARQKDQYMPERESYGLGKLEGKTFRINDIFRELPIIPDDFYSIKAEIMSGRATAPLLCGIDESYYLQPEFYRDNFVDVGLRFYKEPDPTHWTPEGYGTYPNKMESMSYPGATHKVCTFFHSSWGVETYQGLGLKVIYPTESTYNGVVYHFNKTESQKYISAKISPDAVLLSPAYLVFKDDWAQKINISIEISPEAPKGMYAIGFDVTQAPIDQASVWYAEYMSNYQGKSNLGISEPQFTMVIQI